MNQWLLLAGLGCSCLLGTAMTAVRLPGTWWILATAVVFSWWRGWPGGMAWALGLLGGAAILGEIVEFLGSLVLTRRAGASKFAGWGGLLGGLLGAVFLSFVIPIPIVGTVTGALFGCFLGAAVVEFAARKRVAQGTRVGYFAALGFVVGMATKVAVALAMSAGLIAWVVAESRTAASAP